MRCPMGAHYLEISICIRNGFRGTLVFRGGCLLVVRSGAHYLELDACIY